MNKKLFIVSTIMFFVAGSFISSPARAENNITISDIMHVEKKKVNDKGEIETVLAPARETTVTPGEIIQSTIYYKNSGSQAAEGVVIQNRVPDSTIYIGGSAKGAGSVITFSVDGGKSFNKPSKLNIRGPDGKKRKAVPEDYTHIKWVVTKVEPGKEGHVLFRAKIE